MEFDVIKLMQSQDDNWYDLFEQVALADMSEELNEVVPQRTLEESKYYDEKGLPIAPKNFGELIKRKACQEGWYEAIDKEALGLEERGVFEYMTLPQAFAEGYASRNKPPVPMRLLSFAMVRSTYSIRGAKLYGDSVAVRRLLRLLCGFGCGMKLPTVSKLTHCAR